MGGNRLFDKHAKDYFEVINIVRFKMSLNILEPKCYSTNDGFDIDFLPQGFSIIIDHKRKNYTWKEFDCLNSDKNSLIS